MEMATHWCMTNLSEVPGMGQGISITSTSITSTSITSVFTGRDATAIAEEKQYKMEKQY